MSDSTADSSTDSTTDAGPIATVMSAEEQAGFAPDEVIDRMLGGNARFVAGSPRTRDHRAQIQAAVGGQHPMAAVVSCIDSRVPVETVFDCGIGDLFVARVAGNVVNSDVLGSLEFACRVAGAKVVLVLGHQHCGAVKGAIGGVELGNLTGLLERINPSVEAVLASGRARSADDPELVQAVADHNVLATVARIRAESPVLAEMEAAGEIALVGAGYHLEDGTVRLLHEPAPPGGDGAVGPG